MIGFLARIMVGIVFALSGFRKAVAAPQEFAAVVETYQILPSGWVLSFAAVMPWMEILLGLCLIAGYRTRAAAGGLGALLVTFMLALLFALGRGIPLENCGCFGSWISLTPWQALGVDVFLLTLAWMAFRRGRHIFSMDQWVESA